MKKSCEDLAEKQGHLQILQWYQQLSTWIAGRDSVKYHCLRGKKYTVTRS